MRAHAHSQEPSLFSFRSTVVILAAGSVKQTARWHKHIDTNTPAVDNHGASVRRVAGLNPAQESQEGRGVFGDTMIWPGRELEVTDFTLLIGATLNKWTDKSVKGLLDVKYEKCVCVSTRLLVIC